MGFDPVSYILAKKGLKLPTLKGLVIDTDKDWLGYRITNLGEPADPNDAARKIYVDVATTGLGINYYLLDAADSEVPAYKQMSITPPELSEAYVETSQNGAGDYEIGAWIAPAGSIPVLRLGVYTLHFQAERVSGNIGVRFFFRLYERDSEGNETLIAESSLSDLVTDRRNVITSLILPHDYELSEGSRLVLKVYARYLSGGSSTTMRLYYRGDVRSRLATPIAKEILDTIYASISHTHTRSDITDFWDSPFWDSIPDKPSTFPLSLTRASIASSFEEETDIDELAITIDLLNEVDLLAKVFDHPNLSESKAASILDNTNLSESKAEAIWHNANLSDARRNSIGPYLSLSGISKVLYFGEVATWKTKPSPGTAPYGIGGDSSVIWHCDNATDKVYELSTADFSVVRSASSPGSAPYGIGGDSSVIWHCDANAQKVYELSTADFSVVRSANSPRANPDGIGGDSSVIWHCDTDGEYIWELSTADFSVVRSANSPGTYPRGIGGDSSVIWHCDNTTDKVYELSTADFSVVRSTGSPYSNPWGIGGDSLVIWHCDPNADKIYQLGT